MGGALGKGCFLNGELRRAQRKKRLARALGGVEGDGGEGPEAEIYGDVADLLHEGSEFGGKEEARDGFWQVGVGGVVSREETADAGEDFAKIPTIERAEKAGGRFSELENGDGAAGLEDAMNFAEAGFVIGEIAEAEGGGNEVEGAVSERKAESVGLEEWKDARRAVRGRAELRSAFFPGANQHGVSKIRAEDAGLPFPREGKREVTGAAAEIEHIGAGALENWSKEARRAVAPEAIGLKREEMIEEVVARGDFCEHFADFAGSVGFGYDAFGARALGGGGVRRHECEGESRESKVER